MAVVYGRVQRCDNGTGIWATLTDGWGNFANTATDGTFYSTVAYPGYRINASAGGYYAKSYNVTAADISAGWVTICLDATPVTTPPCCFTGETLVLMADGSEQPIERVQPGDSVLGNTGLVNRVLRVMKPLLGRRLLYSLNGSTPFVTSEHPFLSDVGWKAIDPKATLEEGCGVQVSRLMVGDRLLVCKGCLAPAGSSYAGGEPAEIDIGVVELESLHASEAAPTMPLFNLLLEGDHTYIAGGFVVHNKGLY